jgi:hypothetical protein
VNVMLNTFENDLLWSALWETACRACRMALRCKLELEAILHIV